MRRSLELAWQRAQEGQTSLLFVDSQQAAPYCDEIERFAEGEAISLRCCRLSSGRLESPYAPFLPLVRELLKGRDDELADLLSQATEYLPCRELLQQYLSDLPVSRAEPPLLDDLRFEHQALFEAILNLLRLLVTEPTMLAVSEAQLMGISGVSYVNWLVQQTLDIPLLVVMQFDADTVLNFSVEQPEWANFINWLEQDALMLSLPRQAEAGSCQWACCQPALEGDVSANLLRQAQLHLHFFAWDDAIRLVNEALKSLDQDETLWRNGQRLLGDGYFFAGEWDDALAIYESLLDTMSVIGQADIQAELCCQISFTHIARQDFETALQCASSGIQYANQSGNGALLARCWFALYYVHDKSTTPIEVTQFQSLLQLLERHDLKNEQIYALRNSYVMLSFYDSITEAEVLLMIRRAINMARDRGHIPAVAAAYQARGILYSYHCQFKRTLRCFKVSERIRGSYQDPLDLIRIRNGIGHFYTLIEDHHQALKYYSSAFAEARKQHDYSELLVTLYNFSWLYAKARHYKRSIEILEAIQRLANSRRLTHFPFRNLHDIYALKGFCHLKRGELSRAQQCLERLQRLGFQASQTGEFHSQVLRALMSEAVGDLHGAEKTLSSAPALLGLLHQAGNHALPQACLEHARVLHKLSRYDDLRSILNKGLALSETMQMRSSSDEFRRLIAALDAGAEVNFDRVTEALPVVRFELDELIALAEAEEKLDQAHKRMREISLVNRLQGLADRHVETAELASETLRMICISFSVQSGYVFSRVEQTWQQLAEVGGGSSESEVVDELLQVLLKSPRPHVRNQICRRGEGGTRNTYQSQLMVPMIQDGQLCGALILNAYDSAVLFNNNDLSVLELIANQLSAQMTQLVYRSRLLKMSTTDALTRLYNRQAAQIRLQEELKGQRQSAAGKLSLAFIDLDNFKYINDTFGHDVGDLLLEAFSGMLQQSLRSSDIAARWGGDEFIVLLPGLDLAHANQVAQRILNSIVERQHFLPEIANYVDKEVDVPSEMRLSCSIGLALWHAEEREKSDKLLLKEADQALYQAKRQGKGRIVAHTSIETLQLA